MFLVVVFTRSAFNAAFLNWFQRRKYITRLLLPVSSVVYWLVINFHSQPGGQNIQRGMLLWLTRSVVAAGFPVPEHFGVRIPTGSHFLVQVASRIFGRYAGCGQLARAKVDDSPVERITEGMRARLFPGMKAGVRGRPASVIRKWILLPSVAGGLNGISNGPARCTRGRLPLPQAPAASTGRCGRRVFRAARFRSSPASRRAWVRAPALPPAPPWRS